MFECHGKYLKRHKIRKRNHEANRVQRHSDRREHAQHGCSDNTTCRYQQTPGNSEASYHGSGCERVATSDIAGFYYDSDKKRYFRLLPGHNTHSSINHTAFEKKKREKKWEAITSFNARRKSLLTTKPAKLLCGSIALHQSGVVSSNMFSSHVLEKRMAHLKCITKKGVDFVDGYPIQECRYLVGRPEFAPLLGAWALQEAPGVLIQTLTYKNDPTLSQSDRCLSGQVACCPVNIHPCYQVTDLSWADIFSGMHFVLYSCTNCNPMEPASSTVHLLPARNLCDMSTPENRSLVNSVSQNYEFEKTAIWSCAWSQETKHIAIGMEDFIRSTRIETGSGFQLPSNKENPFSMVFNKKGTLLYCGTHKGNLLCLDLRSQKAHITSSTPLGRGISYMCLLSDENFIITSAYDSKLQLVDLRKQQSVLQYADHKNDHMKIPFSFDETSNILCSAGQDQVTRLWSLKDGKLITSFPPPKDCKQEHHPWVWFSESWKHGSDVDNLSLFMAYGKDLLVYRPTLL